eukprot:m51a1_g10284 putative structural maintenance of chromosomes 5 smc5 (286) ;mRNA; f:89233-96000
MKRERVDRRADPSPPRPKRPRRGPDTDSDGGGSGSSGSSGDEGSLVPTTPSSATSRRGPAAEGFVRGSITRVRFERFVTYDWAELRPGPRLNVILGPNGSGKSSVACGIALGLAGNPAILGRAKDPKDFIKHGHKTAAIEIDLHGGNPDKSDTVIRREIREGTSAFYINGRSATQKEVLAACRELNIQVDNLCQFLPQDKVAEFARLSPPELLRETEKAVGPANMLELHTSLAQFKREELDLDVSRRRRAPSARERSTTRWERDGPAKEELPSACALRGDALSRG